MSGSRFNLRRVTIVFGWLRKSPAGEPMTGPQKVVMWVAIGLAILCLLFPYVKHGGSRVVEVLRAKNPQFEMNRTAWTQYRKTFDTDGTQSDKPQVPEEFRKSGRFLYPAVSGSGEWGYWYFYQPEQLELEYVNLKRTESTNAFRFLFSDFKSYSNIIFTVWFVELVVIFLVGKGLIAQLRTRDR